MAQENNGTQQPNAEQQPNNEQPKKTPFFKRWWVNLIGGAIIGVAGKTGYDAIRNRRNK